MAYYRKAKLIGQLLLQKNMITPEHLRRASLEHRRNGGRLGSVLVRLGFINEDNLYQALSEQLGVEFVKLKNIKIPPSAIEQIPAKFATRYALMPIKTEGNRIIVATSNPMDLIAMDNLRFLLGKIITPVLSTENDIEDAIKRHYGLGAETIEEIVPEFGVENIPDVQAPVTEDIIKFSKDPSIVRFVNQLLLEAYKSSATDIHIEPYEDELRIRYRIDGILYDETVPANIKRFQSAIISRIKIMANLDITERRLPQDGRFKIKIIDEELDLRVSVFPSLFGEAIVIRLLSTKIRYGLDNLGFSGGDLEIFKKLVKRPHGIIFLTGPTGSGKTTALYAALSSINSSEKKILTIEDPIEYQLKGIVQTQVNPKIGLTFSQSLRSFFRHDPDIIMVGEVRDYETAEMAIRVALTGHIVFSTIHTNDAAGGIARLIDMGVQPFLVASSVNAFIAQRLVRIICPNCKTETSINSELLTELESNAHDISKIRIYEGQRCELCKYTGYKGRTGIYEILVVASPIEELILKKATSEQIKNKAIELGMHTLRQDGWDKVIGGITTAAEVMRVTRQEEAQEIKQKIPVI